jgi:hypothetical protein
MSDLSDILSPDSKNSARDTYNLVNDADKYNQRLKTYESALGAARYDKAAREGAANVIDAAPIQADVKDDLAASRSALENARDKYKQTGGVYDDKADKAVSAAAMKKQKEVFNSLKDPAEQKKSKALVEEAYAAADRKGLKGKEKSDYVMHQLGKIDQFKAAMPDLALARDKGANEALTKMANDNDEKMREKAKGDPASKKALEDFGDNNKATQKLISKLDAGDEQGKVREQLEALSKEKGLTPGQHAAKRKAIMDDAVTTGKIGKETAKAYMDSAAEAGQMAMRPEANKAAKGAAPADNTTAPTFGAEADSSVVSNAERANARENGGSEAVRARSMETENTRQKSPAADAAESRGRDRARGAAGVDSDAKEASSAGDALNKTATDVQTENVAKATDPRQAASEGAAAGARKEEAARVAAGAAKADSPAKVAKSAARDGDAIPRQVAAAQAKEVAKATDASRQAVVNTGGAQMVTLSPGTTITLMDKGVARSAQVTTGGVAA